MRITTANAFENSVRTLQQRAQALTESQDRLTSGKRVQRASDDPTAASRVERALAAQARTEADERALQASRNALAQTETALSNADDLLQSARELVVAAGNASYTDAERANLGQRLRGLREQLLQVANRGDGAGGHLFGGQGTAQPPFLDTSAGVQYRGEGGRQMIDAGEPLPMTLDGQAAWLQARTGNGVFLTSPAAGNGTAAWVDGGRVTNPAALTGDSYSVVFAVSGSSTTYSVLRNGAATAITGQAYVSGQAIEFDGMALSVSGAPANGDAFDATPSTPTLSVFDVMERTAQQLVTANRTGAQVTQTVQAGLRDLDSSMLRLQAYRADAGEMLNRADMVEGRLGEKRVAAQAERSLAEDLDMVAAVSQFQARQTGYDAALKSYAMVQRLSLFQYING